MDKRLERILPRVQKPARYVGGEFNAIMKDKRKVDTRVAFCFPDTYEIGMSNLGMRILYGVMNNIEGVWCERCFAPWGDMEQEMRNANIPLYALESFDPIKDFDIIAFSIGYEMAFPAMVDMLDLAGVPLHASERTALTPLVIAGGTAMYNCEPIADFIDLALIGEGEEMDVELIELHRKARREGWSKHDFLVRAAQIRGIYVPSLYDVVYNDDGTVKSITANEGAPKVVLKRIMRDMDKAVARIQKALANDETIAVFGDYDVDGITSTVLLLDYLIGAMKRSGKMPANPVALKTIVTTEMARKVAESNGVKCFDTFTGFKFMAEKKNALEESGEGKVIFSYEESYGYMLGDYVRDKDAVTASMLLTEMAAWYDAQGMTLFDALNALYEKYGWYAEKTHNLVMPGLDGLRDMAKLMKDLRENPPAEISSVKVIVRKDYTDGSVIDCVTGAKSRMELSGSNVLRYELEDGTVILVRPSGTEPKIKVYILTQGADAAASNANLEKYGQWVAALKP